MPRLTASNATDAGSVPASARTTTAPARSPQVASWSAAAARKVSAAPSTTCRPSATSTRASLPVVVVLPVPLTPTISSTDGRPSCGSARTDRSISGPTASISTRRSSALALAASVTPCAATSARSFSVISAAAPAPRSAISRVSSTSVQESSSRVPAPSRPSRTGRTRSASGTAGRGAVQPAGGGLDVARPPTVGTASVRATGRRLGASTTGLRRPRRRRARRRRGLEDLRPRRARAGSGRLRGSASSAGRATSTMFLVTRVRGHRGVVTDPGWPSTSVRSGARVDRR